ncbi:MAG: hypothetical protein WBG37_22190 [Desulfobacterales bacterium]
MLSSASWIFCCGFLVCILFSQLDMIRPRIRKSYVSFKQNHGTVQVPAITPPSQKQIRFEYPAIYSIQVLGYLDKGWSNRLSDLTIQPDDPALTNGIEMTTLKGELMDQSALIGVLNALYNLRLTIWSVECLGIPKNLSLAR